MILLASLALGLASALFPPLNIEAYLVGLAALHSGPVLWLAVLATTVGHMGGKLLFYSLGRGWLTRRLPSWLARHDPEEHGAGSADGAASGGSLAVEPAVASREPGALRSRLVRWSMVSRVEALAERPWATAALCFVSAAAGIPPFAIVAVLLGRFRMPVGAFLLCGGLGRLVRFGAVAGASGAVLG